MSSERTQTDQTENKAIKKRVGTGCLFFKHLARLLMFALLILIVFGYTAYYFFVRLNAPVTLLLLGSDNRQNSGPSRSDAIFVLRTDPRQGIIRGLSLPRDLYVPISGLPLTRKTDRLNTALFWGDYYSGSQGTAAARQTIGNLIAVPVDGAVVVHFNLIRELIDAIGGVEIYFEKPIMDKTFQSLWGESSYTLRFESGWNYLNGRRAMELIRVRKPDTDFGRMNRNRQLLNSVVTRLKSMKACVSLILLLPSVHRNVNMDCGPQEIARLAWAIYRNRQSGIQWNTITKDEVYPSVTATGNKVLVADPSALIEAGRLLLGQPQIYAGAPPAASSQIFGQPIR